MTVIVMNNGGGAAGTDLSQDDITPEQVREGVHFHNRRGEPKEGVIPNYSGSPKNGASPAGAGDKWTLQQQSGTKHIPAGCYLNKDIEIPAKQVGSATLKLNGKTATMTKVAGYIESGTVTKTVPDAVFNDGAISGNTVSFKAATAGYVAKGQLLSKALPLETQKDYGTIRGNGGFTINPSGGYIGMKQVVLTVDVPAATPSLQNKTVSISASQTITPDAGYSGMSSVTVNVAVPTPNTASVSAQGTGILVTGDAGKTIASVSLVANNRASGCVMAGHVINSGAASSTGRAVVEQSNGDVALGNVLRAIFNGNTVTITATDGWNFNGADYTAYVSYK